MTTDKEIKPEKVYELWQVMEKFGIYQIKQYLFISIAVILVKITVINFIFVAGDINYRCRVPQCEASPSTYNTQWWPNTTSTIDRCSKPVLNESLTNNNCTLHSFTGSVKPCTDWVYESRNTVVEELNLACQPLKINLIGTIHSIGLLISMPVGGWLSDSVGRKPALIIFSMTTCIGVLKTFVTSYYVYLVIEFLEAFLSSGTFPAALVLMFEMVSSKKRIVSGVVFSYGLYIGEFLFAIVAMNVPYWKTLIRILYTPSVLCVSYIYLLRESPRWQFLNKKKDEALETLEIMAKVNKMKIIKQDQADIEQKLKEKLNLAKVDHKESYKRIFTSKVIWLRLIVGMVIRFTSTFVYFGLMINSVFLPGNKYTNFLLSSVMSFPGDLICLYFMNKIGRKLPLIVGFIVCGAMCVGSGYLPASCTSLKIVLFLLSKMVVSVCYTGSITYSLELFPTNVRVTLIGLCSLCSRSGTMLAPLTPILSEVSEILPVLIFGGFAVLAGVLITLTPETKDLPLMDTLEQIEASMKETKKNKDIVITAL